MEKAINLKELLFFYFILTLGFFLYTSKVLWCLFYNRSKLQVIPKRTTKNKYYIKLEVLKNHEQNTLNTRII
jgi:hypothetical protein